VFLLYSFQFSFYSYVPQFILKCHFVGEYGGNVMYACMKMEKRYLWKLFQEWEERDKGE
jgi:hypothetical protein